jgi:hypothetical protein
VQSSHRNPRSSAFLPIVVREIKVQMRKDPQVEQTSRSRKLSPPIDFRQGIGQTAPPALRVFRDLPIFRENNA